MTYTTNGKKAGPHICMRHRGHTACSCSIDAGTSGHTYAATDNSLPEKVARIREADQQARAAMNSQKPTSNYSGKYSGGRNA